MSKLGGLSGKATLIKKITDASLFPPLVIDSGNLLFKRSGNARRNQAEMSTAETIMKSYSKMGYDAVAVSSSDLTAGMEFFTHSAEAGFPWLSANITDLSGKALFKASILKDIGKITVDVIGITGQGSLSDKRMVINDWKEPLRRHLQSLGPEVDMVVLLSNLSTDENSSIEKLFPEIDLIITADRKRGNLSPYISGNCLITQTQARGKYLGQISIEFNKSGRWYSDNRGKTVALEGRIGSIDTQIRQLEKRGDKEGIHSGRIGQLVAAQKDLERQLVVERSRVKCSPGEIVNRFKANFIPVKPVH